MTNDKPIQINSAEELIDALNDLSNRALEIENETTMFVSMLNSDHADYSNKIEGLSKENKEQALGLLEGTRQHLETVEEEIEGCDE